MYNLVYKIMPLKGLSIIVDIFLSLSVLWKMAICSLTVRVISEEVAFYQSIKRNCNTRKCCFHLYFESLL